MFVIDLLHLGADTKTNEFIAVLALHAAHFLKGLNQQQTHTYKIQQEHYNST